MKNDIQHTPFTATPKIHWRLTDPARLHLASLRAYLSRPTRNALLNAGIETLGDIAKVGAKAIAKMDGIGERRFQEIASCMRAYCLRF